jgi:glycosyltransferase involved in cell wall biosynthesis
MYGTVEAYTVLFVEMTLEQTTLINTMADPLVVVCTPTYNRGFTVDFSAMVMMRQTYKNIHWIVIDNSSDEEQSWSKIKTKKDEIPPLTYIRILDKKPIGEMRNICLKEAKKLNPKYIAFWDDDDYYPPQRIQKSVEALEAESQYDIVGCEIMPVFIAKDNVMVEVGPYGANHATASVWVFRTSITDNRKFFDGDDKSEEGNFTRDWTLSMKMIPHKDAILVIGHSRNTVSKEMIAENPKKFAGKFTETANGKNIVRFQWFQDRKLWDCFCKTFALGVVNQ